MSVDGGRGDGREGVNDEASKPAVRVGRSGPARRLRGLPVWVRDIFWALLPEWVQRIWLFINGFRRRMTEHDLREHATSMAFFSLLAIFPTMVGVLGLLSFFDLYTEVRVLEHILADALPPGASVMVMDEVHQILDDRVGRPLTLSLVAALYYAGRALAVAIDGVNRAWETTRGRWIARRLQGLGAAGVFILFSIIALIAAATEGVLLNWLAGRGWLPVETALGVAVLRIPVILIFAQQTLNLLYRIGSGLPGRGWSTLGSWLAAFALGGISWVFRAFVSEVTDLGATYGSLGTVVGLMLYLQAGATAILLGAEIDAQRYELKHGRG